MTPEAIRHDMFPTRLDTLPELLICLLAVTGDRAACLLLSLPPDTQVAARALL